MSAVLSVSQLQVQLKEAYPGVVANFDELFALWKASWFSGENEYSSR
jgi:hypothetical protein